MSGDVLAEAVEAAAREMLRQQGLDPATDAYLGTAWIEAARLIVAAALPVVLAKLADRIEAADIVDNALYGIGRRDGAAKVRAFAAEVTG